MACPICCQEDLKLINCQYCTVSACVTCWQQYMINEQMSICMNKNTCSEPWTRSYIVRKFPKSFVVEWTNIMKKYHYDQQIALMPETTQYLVELRLKQTADIHHILQKLRAQLQANILDTKRLIITNTCRSLFNDDITRCNLRKIPIRVV